MLSNRPVHVLFRKRQTREVFFFICSESRLDEFDRLLREYMYGWETSFNDRDYQFASAALEAAVKKPMVGTPAKPPFSTRRTD